MGVMQIQLIPLFAFIAGLMIPASVLAAAAIDTAKAEDGEDR